VCFSPNLPRFCPVIAGGLAPAAGSNLASANSVNNLKITCKIQVMIEYIERSVNLPLPGKETFFLWGSRQTGKSTLLHHTYPHAFRIDLLKSEEFRHLL
jgi:hypothetical protein